MILINIWLATSVISLYNITELREAQQCLVCVQEVDQSVLENTLINYNQQVTSKQDILNSGLKKDLISSHCRIIDLKTIQIPHLVISQLVIMIAHTMKTRNCQFPVNTIASKIGMKNMANFKSNSLCISSQFAHPLCPLSRNGYGIFIRQYIKSMHFPICL